MGYSRPDNMILRQAYFWIFLSPDVCFFKHHQGQAWSRYLMEMEALGGISHEEEMKRRKLAALEWSLILKQIVSVSK